MSCYRPVPGFRDRTGGSVRIGYWAGEVGDALELPCGRCIGCRLDKARAWSIRIGHEAQLYDSNLFVTLDYAPEHLPKSLSLELPDFQGFMKRLRRRVCGVTPGPDGRRPIRFFCAGEYGTQFQRPHWHAILFNCDFRDKERYFNGSFRSSLAEDIWGRGNVVLGTVTPRSAAYVAGYTLKKATIGSRYRERDHITGKKYQMSEDVLNTSTGELSSRRREFVVMSRRPGIGARWYERFHKDLFPLDSAVQEGREYKVPRFYWERFKWHADPLEVEAISEARYERSRLVEAGESTPERRAVREEVARARSELFGDRQH